MRGRWKYDRATDQVIDADEYDRRKWAGTKVSSLPAPMLISDCMQPVQSMVDGQWYDSKAALRRTYTPSGNKKGERYLEVGNEEIKPRSRPKPDRKAIRESIQKAAARVGI